MALATMTREVRFKQDMSRSVADWNTQLYSPSCARDVRLVCADGQMDWSALSLAHWSGVVRELLAEAGAHSITCQAREPMVLLLPDVTLALMKKVLVWSTEGEVVLGRQETERVLDVLVTLGVMVTVVQSHAEDEEDGSAEEQEQQQHQQQHHHQQQQKQRQQQEEVQDDPSGHRGDEEAVDAAMAEEGDAGGDEELVLDGEGVTESLTCGDCGLVVSTVQELEEHGYECQGGGGVSAPQEDFVPYHNGGGDVYQQQDYYTPPPPPPPLKQMKPHYQQQQQQQQHGQNVFKPAQSSSRGGGGAGGSSSSSSSRGQFVFKFSYNGCDKCALGFRSVGDAWAHLAYVHFKAEMGQLFGGGKACAICREPLRNPHARASTLTFSRAYHMSVKHREQIEPLVPAEIREILSAPPRGGNAVAGGGGGGSVKRPAPPPNPPIPTFSLKRFRNMHGPQSSNGASPLLQQQSSSPSPTSSSYPSGYDANAGASAETDRARGLLRELFGECNTCDAFNFQGAVFVYRHLAYSHFVSEILDLFGDAPQCALCGKDVLGAGFKTPSDRKLTISYHMAGMHRDRIKEWTPRELVAILDGKGCYRPPKNSAAGKAAAAAAAAATASSPYSPMKNELKPQDDPYSPQVVVPPPPVEQQQQHFRSSHGNFGEVSSQVRQIVSAHYQGCNTCSEFNFMGPVFVWRHLAYKHHIQECMVLFGGGVSCALCKKPVLAQTLRKQRKGKISNHMASAHRDKLSELGPAGLWELLSGLKQSGVMMQHYGSSPSSVSPRQQQQQHAMPPQRPVPGMSGSSYISRKMVMGAKKWGRKGRAARLADANCSDCRRGYSNLTLLKQHLASSSHFQDALVRAYSHDGTCNVCGKVFRKGEELSGAEKMRLAQHVGTGHGLIREVVPEDVRAALRRLAMAAKRNAAMVMSNSHGGGGRGAGDGEEEEVSGPFRLDGMDCNKCSSGFSSWGRLKRHVSFAHYADHLVAQFGSAEDNRSPHSCGICQSSFTCKKSLVLHVGALHDKILEIVPGPVQAEFQSLLTHQGHKIWKRADGGGRSYSPPPEPLPVEVEMAMSPHNVYAGEEGEDGVGGLGQGHFMGHQAEEEGGEEALNDTDFDYGSME